MLCAGIPRYELAHLYDIEDRHLEALRLHTINREQYPRFYRGRYRLGMSLEMIANPKFILPNDGNKANKAKEDLCESLRILDGCRITHDAARFRHCITLGKPLPHKLRKELLNAAQKELRTVRRQLTLRRITWAAIVHRDERAIWKRYWRLTERQRFQDSVRVAELLVTVRQSLKENGRDGHTELSTGHGPPVDRADMCPCAEQEQQQEGHPGKVTNNVRIQSFLKVLLARYRRRKAMNITAAIAGDRSAIIRRYRSAIDAALRSEEWQPPKKMEKMQPGPRARRTRWVPWQQRTPSWQAAYNTACLYAALAGKYDKDKIRKDKLTELVVASLEREAFGSMAGLPCCPVGRCDCRRLPAFGGVCGSAYCGRARSCVLRVSEMSGASGEVVSRCTQSSPRWGGKEGAWGVLVEKEEKEKKRRRPKLRGRGRGLAGLRGLFPGKGGNS